MKNYLITKEYLEEQYKGMGKDIFKEIFVIQSRGTGKSTAMALECISECIKNPGKEYYIQDHHCTRQADNHLRCIMGRMVDMLGLKGFEFNRGRGIIKFNLYEVLPESFLKFKNKKEK